MLVPFVFSAGLATDNGNASSFKTITMRKISGKWALDNYRTYHFLGKTAGQSKLQLYYDFRQQFCPNGNPTVADCLNQNIDQNHFKENAAKKLKAHYLAGNPNQQPRANPAGWVMNFGHTDPKIPEPEDPHEDPDDSDEEAQDFTPQD